MDSNKLVVRKRALHGQDLWWIGRGTGRNFVFYLDIFAPTGYGYRSKDEAKLVAFAIEERLKASP